MEFRQRQAEQNLTISSPCNAVLAREHLSSELSDAIGRIVKARDELRALLDEIASRTRY